MRRLIGIACMALCVGSCDRGGPPRVEIQLTEGTLEARQALASEIMKTLTPVLKDRIRQRLPTVNADVLNGLLLNAGTSTTGTGDQRQTTVYLKCLFGHNWPVDDSAPVIIDVCKEAVLQELSAKRGQ